jgi:hypothetical protein
MDKLESWVERFDPAAALRVALVLAALGGGIALAGTCAGCGATPRDHHMRLNALTSVADPTYAIAVEVCDTMRDAINARPGTTYAQDRAAMDRVNSKCDAVVNSFELIGDAQRGARSMIDAGDGQAKVIAAVAAALAMWPEVQALARDIDALGRVQ